MFLLARTNSGEGLLVARTLLFNVQEGWRVIYLRVSIILCMKCTTPLDNVVALLDGLCVGESTEVEIDRAVESLAGRRKRKTQSYGVD